MRFPLLLALAAGFFFSTGCQKSAQPELTDGGPAPDFTGTTLDGQSIRLSDFRGQPVVLNFWATWCGPCREETPDFVAMQEEYGESVRFLGVALEEDAGPVQAFADEYAVNYPIIVDAEGSIVQHYPDVFGLPTTLLLDEAGVVRKRWVGQVHPKDLKPVLEELRTG